MSTRRVTIIILAWNHWELTERCLEGVQQCTDLGDADVIVVDNGSTDQTAAKLRGYDWLRTVTTPMNLGFVRGNNAGISVAAPNSDVVLLNNDIEIWQPGWLDELRNVAHGAPDIGIVGCRLTRPDGRLLHAGTYILPDTFWGQQIGGGESDLNQYVRPRTVQGIVFACAYLKRETLQAIGLLSERYVSYFEDTDYCLRAAQAGLRTVCHGGVSLVHQEHGSTRDDPRLFNELFTSSQRVFRREWQAALEARYLHRLSWQSTLNIPGGYAMSCRALLRALEEEAVRVSYSYIYGEGSPSPTDEPEDAGDYLLNVIKNRPVEPSPDISVVYGQGDVFRRNRGQYRIGYTMLEVDGFPEAWVRQANTMDEVWVPSRFNRDALVRCGVTRPIEVMPLGVDIDHFHPTIAAERNPAGDFVFLANFEWGERKQPELLLKVFNAVFRQREPVVLVCKISNRDESVDLRREIDALGLRSSGGRIGFIYNRVFPYHELGLLYRSADCFVSASRGEGWDLPLMEAMACGLPTIATDWGAHTEFVHSANSYPLRIRGTIPAEARCPYYEGFAWADPDPVHLTELLRYVFEHREEAAAIGRQAATEMANRWTWTHAARRIRDRLGVVMELLPAGRK